MLYFIKKIIPKRVFAFFQPTYHYLWAFLSAVWFRFPSRKLFVIGVTGTKGKTSVTEIINAILEEAGYRTALSNTIRFKVGDDTTRNLYKMGMPGRGFLQHFLRRAVRKKCDYAIIEMTSEGARLFRHAFIDLDAFIFTNLAPEHIESHGSFEQYRDAKLALREALTRSSKKKRWVIANKDDEHGELFLDAPDTIALPYSLKGAEPYTMTGHGVVLTVGGMSLASHLIGVFNIYNILAAVTFTQTQNIDLQTAKRALEKLKQISGRAEFISLPEGHPSNKKQKFKVVVDYAHTNDSLEKLYQSFPDTYKVCVLGNTGGGRDTWKRPQMAAIADSYCDKIILTNEDPYDEDPQKILEDMKDGITKHRPEIILDRREAISKALLSAKTKGQKTIVLITGKGTDPYIMGANNSKTPWSDADVVREELEDLLEKGT